MEREGQNNNILERGWIAFSGHGQEPESSCGFTFTSNNEKGCGVATATTSPSLFADPAPSPSAKAAALHVQNQMRGWNSAKGWALVIVWGFFLNPVGIFQPDQPSEQVCCKAVLAEQKHWHRLSMERAQLSPQHTHRGNLGVLHLQTQSQ